MAGTCKQKFHCSLKRVKMHFLNIFEKKVSITLGKYARCLRCRMNKKAEYIYCVHCSVSVVMFNV